MSTLIETPNLEVKDTLAKLFAGENIRVEHSKSASTAMFNMESRVLTLPVWNHLSNEMYDMLIAHEVGHALFTPVDFFWSHLVRIGLVDADFAEKKMRNWNYKGMTDREREMDRVATRFHPYINVVEDPRIERLIKRKYPGVKSDFYHGYIDMCKHDFFGKDIESRLPSMDLLDRINLYFKGGHYYDVPFTDEERVFVNKVASTVTYDDVVDVAKEIWDYLIEHAEDSEDEKPITVLPDLEGDESFEFADDDGEDTSDDSSDETSDPTPLDDDGDAADVDEDAGDDGDVSVDDETEDTGETDSGRLGGTAPPVKGDGDDDDDDDLPALPETYDALEDALSDRVDTSDGEIEYLAAPVINLDEVLKGHKVVSDDLIGTMKRHLERNTRGYSGLARKYKNFVKEHRASVNYLASVFERKCAADRHARTMESKSGKLNVSKLHRYKFDDDLFLRYETTPDGKSHGLVVMIDWSSSMNEVAHDTIEQALVLSMFAKRVKIPFSVILFTTDWGYGRANERWEYIDGRDCIEFRASDNFKLVEILSSEMNNSTYKDVSTALLALPKRSRWSQTEKLGECMGMGGTPLNESVLAMETFISRFRAKNRLDVVNMILITDGEGAGIGNAIGADGERRTIGYGNTLILTDEKSRKNYKLDSYGFGTTAGFLERLKDRTGSNIIGFYIGGAYEATRVFKDYTSREYETSDALWEDIKSNTKERCTFIPEVRGYDEMYFIPTNRMELDKNTFTKRGLSDIESLDDLSEVFKSHMKTSVQNKIMLTRLADRLTTANF
jgi:hypothetical protein